MGSSTVALLVVVGFLASVAQASVIRSSYPNVPAWLSFQNSVAPIMSQKAPLLSQLGFTISKFTHSNCGGPNDVVKINSLTVSRDLHFTLSVTASAEVVAPIQVEIEISKKVLFWVKIPCLGGKIGSCTYSDICSRLARRSECPAQAIALGIPCKCPFSAATYHVQDVDLDLEFLGDSLPSIPLSLVAGNYKLQAEIQHHGQKLACIKATFTLHD